MDLKKTEMRKEAKMAYGGVKAWNKPESKSKAGIKRKRGVKSHNIAAG